MRSSNKNKRQSGFTLIEVAIAFGISTLVALGAIGLLASTQRTVAKTRRQAKAVSLAYRTVESITSLTGATGGGSTFDTMLKSAESPFSGANGGVSTASLGTGGTWTASKDMGNGYTRTMQLRNEGTDPAGLLTLRIEVSWVDLAGSKAGKEILRTKVFR